MMAKEPKTDSKSTNTSGFRPNVQPHTEVTSGEGFATGSSQNHSSADHRVKSISPSGPPEAAPQEVGREFTPSNGWALEIALAATLNALFFAFTWAVPSPFVQRYFLGHPVAIAETIFFLVGLGLLVSKALKVRQAARLTAGIRESELLPSLPTAVTDSDLWSLKHDTARVARLWLESLGQLPTTIRRGPLVTRLIELLERQENRKSTEHLADDLREVASRELDRAYESFSLLRIIVWAIPMLGFLGTVVGITQTLGNLDFSNGAAAVDQLKSGLYVAFDTTAIGIVFAVFSIFLQFPIERSEQNLLAEVDRRVGALLAQRLPGNEQDGNPTAHISLLCDGIRVAVAQSLASQAEVWKQTIDEAREYWRLSAEDNSRKLSQAMIETLAPVLQIHSRAFDEHATALRGHSQTLSGIEEHLGQEVARTWELWEAKIENRFAELDQQSRSAEQMAEGLSEAMLALARAVDSLGKQLSPAARGNLLKDMAEAVERTDSVVAKAESATTSKRKRAA